MNQPPRIHLFQGYGLELEYMIVDRNTLAVKPVADELLRQMLGSYGSDYDNGMVTWSNELVLHVIELKSSRPEKNLRALAVSFHENVQQINKLLEPLGAQLMPTAMHPLMDPHAETRLWPHENNEVYALYNTIFDCRGHGWSNLQSTHINLPFYDDEEFSRLHAAVRLVLPIIPALCASSPVVQGRLTGSKDTRLKYYKTNQSKIPSITGRIIPEAVFSKRNYIHSIYEKIRADVAPYNQSDLLDPIWVNSRGAIARFDRGSVEIRLIDSQECPKAEMAVAALVIELVKALAEERFMDYETQTKCRTEGLAQILELCMEQGEQAIIRDADYIRLFGLCEKEVPAGVIWSSVLNELTSQPGNSLQTWKATLEVILEKGTLANRVISALNGQSESDSIRQVYRTLCACLDKNELFIP